MIIYVLIPVFNRLNLTKNIISCLRRQSYKKNLRIYVVNDGSTDGTGDWLNQQCDVNTIKGNGSLLWTGAINLGLETLLKKVNSEDWLLLLNNDIEINEDYVETLFKIAKENYPAAVGSIIKNKNGKIVSIGPKINTKYLKVNDLYDVKRNLKYKKIIKNLDALSGRGVIYPIESIMKVKRINQIIFPHYFADYELSIRIKKKGYSLLLSNEACVYTNEDFKLISIERGKHPLFKKLFSKKSSSLIYSQFFFWWRASNNIERITLPLRIFIFNILPVLRKVL